MIYTESGTPMLNWDSRYLCYFSTEMAEIWSPGTFSEDVWTYKISALYLLYFESCESFCGGFSDFHSMFHRGYDLFNLLLESISLSYKFLSLQTGKKVIS